MRELNYGFEHLGGELHLGKRVQLFNGDSRQVLKRLPDNSVDSVVTDPPYALVSIVKRFGSANAAPARDGDVYARASAGFMGKQWDTGETAFAVEFWAEVMRVLKPGGHVIAASGTRTYHRLAVAIEDAGFEIRDMVSWLYGSGFPKSHDVSKGIDRAAGAVRALTREGAVKRDGYGEDWDTGTSADRPRYDEPATPEAAAWQGWGTALKPACEPWVLARKPLVGTVAANVLAHGTGALNIDGCRVGVTEADARDVGRQITRNVRDGEDWGMNGGSAQEGVTVVRADGRWPANVIHDGSDEVVGAFPTTGGSSKVGEARPYEPNHGNAVYGAGMGGGYHPGFGDGAGSAARFFYSAKADALDRVGTKHPTVKPVDLMEYFCRLVTPPGGTVLDPFAGSGTTGEAAWRQGFNAILIERESDYAADIRERLRLAECGEATKRRAIAAKKPRPVGNDPAGQVGFAL